MKTRLITWAIFAGAFLDTIYGVIADNAGLLAELGISPKATKIVMVLGLIWNTFSKSLTDKREPNTFLDDEIGLPKPVKK